MFENFYALQENLVQRYLRMYYESIEFTILLISSLTYTDFQISIFNLASKSFKDCSFMILNLILVLCVDSAMLLHIILRLPEIASLLPLFLELNVVSFFAKLGASKYLKSVGDILVKFL